MVCRRFVGEIQKKLKGVSYQKSREKGERSSEVDEINGQGGKIQKGGFLRIIKMGERKPGVWGRTPSSSSWRNQN